MDKKKLKKKTRSYDGTARMQKTQAVSREIIETLIELLVANKGGDVPFKELSQKSKIPLRTIFRLFKDKQALHEATEKYLSGIISASIDELSKFDFITFAKNTFQVYDRHEGLVIAYLFSPFGQQARDILRKKFNQLLQAQILKERKIKLTPETEQKMALIVSLVNAKIWYDIRTDYGYSGGQIGTTIGWALEILLKNLES